MFCQLLLSVIDHPVYNKVTDWACCMNKQYQLSPCLGQKSRRAETFAPAWQSEDLPLCTGRDQHCLELTEGPGLVMRQMEASARLLIELAVAAILCSAGLQ